jgi:uncharacterized protein (UPF0332 family)
MKDFNNRELIIYRIEKARGTFNEAKIQITNQLWNLAINRMYYACFYAVNALLLSKGINARTHSGVKTMFGLHFVNSGIFSKEENDLYTNLFRLRQEGDYEDFTTFDESDALYYLEPAGIFIARIEFIINHNLSEMSATSS